MFPLRRLHRSRASRRMLQLVEALTLFFMLGGSSMQEDELEAALQAVVLTQEQLQRGNGSAQF